MSACPMCKKWNDDADLRIVELDYCYVLLNRDQFFSGYCFVFTKTHVTELFHLDIATRQGIIEEVNAVAAALDKVFQPTKSTTNSSATWSHICTGTSCRASLTAPCGRNRSGANRMRSCA